MGRRLIPGSNFPFQSRSVHGVNTHPRGKKGVKTMFQSGKLILFIIAFAFANLALLGHIKAGDSGDTPYGGLDPSDIFYGTGAGNLTTTGNNDSAFGYNPLHNNTSGSF